MCRLRERMSITLYGSYYPPAEMRLLERQRDHLAGMGYALAGLVNGGTGGGVGPLAASKRCLENSDVNFHVFIKADKRLGLVRELVDMADAMGSKADDGVVFDQVVDGRGSIQDLSLRDLRNARIYEYKLRDE